MAQTTNYNFEIPDDTDLVKDGALAMRDLGQDVDTQLFTALGGDYPGLRLIKKQTIGTTVSSVVVNDAFSATYENYKIIVTGGVGSATNDLRIALNGITTGYYSNLSFTAFNSATAQGAIAGNEASWNWFGSSNTSGIYATAEILSPFLTKAKRYTADFINMSITGAAGRSNGINLSATSATGFTINTTGGTLTGGTVYVYGYGVS
jgi:hypothetical protein